MALTLTPALAVQSIIPDTTNSGMFTLLLASPFVAPLCLGMVQVGRKLSGPDVTGTVVQGTAANPGTAFVDMNPTTYANAVAKAVLPCKVIVTYDDLTKVVSNLEILPAHTILHRGAAVVASS